VGFRALIAKQNPIISSGCLVLILPIDVSSHLQQHHLQCFFLSSLAFAIHGALLQAKAADLELGILEILQDARGRGKEGLTAEQQETLAASVEQLEAVGGLKVKKNL